MPTVSRAASAACASAVSSTGAAAEVGDPRRGRRFDEREQVEERLRPLVLKPVVLLGIPGVRHRHSVTSSVGGT